MQHLTVKRKIAYKRKLNESTVYKHTVQISTTNKDHHHTYQLRGRTKTKTETKTEINYKTKTTLETAFSRCTAARRTKTGRNENLALRGII